MPDDSQLLKQFAFHLAKNWPSSIREMIYRPRDRVTDQGTDQGTDRHTETQTDAVEYFPRS